MIQKTCSGTLYAEQVVFDTQSVTFTIFIHVIKNFSKTFKTILISSLFTLIALFIQRRIIIARKCHLYAAFVHSH